MRKPITNPVDSEYIRLTDGSRIHWDRWQVLNKKAVAFEVVCGVCQQPRWVRRNSLLTAVRKMQYFTGVCRNCMNYTPPPARPGYKKSYARTITSEGYITVVVSGLSPDDQALCEGMTQKNSVSPRVLEHRLVMARMLGRPLLRSEVVHHKNGNKTDNREDNLELRVAYHGKGQESHDLHKEIKRLRAILGAHGIDY